MDLTVVLRGISLTAHDDEERLVPCLSALYRPFLPLDSLLPPACLCPHPPSSPPRSQATGVGPGRSSAQHPAGLPTPSEGRLRRPCVTPPLQPHAPRPPAPACRHRAGLPAALPGCWARAPGLPAVPTVLGHARRSPPTFLQTRLPGSDDTWGGLPWPPAYKIQHDTRTVSCPEPLPAPLLHSSRSRPGTPGVTYLLDRCTSAPPRCGTWVP